MVITTNGRRLSQVLFGIVPGIASGLAAVKICDAAEKMLNEKKGA